MSQRTTPRVRRCGSAALRYTHDRSRRGASSLRLMWRHEQRSDVAAGAGRRVPRGRLGGGAGSSGAAAPRFEPAPRWLRRVVRIGSPRTASGRATGRASSRAYVELRARGSMRRRATRGAPRVPRRPPARARDGADALGRAGDRDDRPSSPRSSTCTSASSQWLADARGLERTPAARGCATTRTRWLPRPRRAAAADRAPEAAAEGDAAPRAARDPGPDPAPRGGARLPAAGHSVLHARAPARRPARSCSGSTWRTSSRRSPAARVYGIFRSAGYPEAVAHALAALCTNVVPRASGPPAARRALTGWYRLAGARDAAPAAGRADLAGAGEPLRARARPPALGLARGRRRYSRYADDLALSGDRWLIAHAARAPPTVARDRARGGLPRQRRASRG